MRGGRPGRARTTDLFWAVLLRGAGWESESRPGSRSESGDGVKAGIGDGAALLLERTRLLPRRGAVQLLPGRLQEAPASASRRTGAQRGVRGLAVALDLALDEDAGIEAVCPHGENRVWEVATSGRASRPASQRAAPSPWTGSPPRAIDALAVIDDTAGYHARVTEWCWAAGVGVDPAGHRSRSTLSKASTTHHAGSERGVWIAGAPHEVSPVGFAADLSRISATDGSELRFEAEAQRSRSENLLLVSSEYEAPFGTFSGTLPGGVALAHGLGVVEYHLVRR